MKLWPAVLALLQVASGEPPSPETLLEVARQGPEPVLTELASEHPAAVREAFALALRRSVRADALQADVLLAAAGRLAAAHASAWDDPFLVRQVELFASRTREHRITKLTADSLRRAGVDVFAEQGSAPAILLWHRSLGMARSVADSAAMAAAMQNLGAAFLQESALDSAEVYLRTARALAGSVGDRLIEGNALGALHFVRVDRGDLVGARSVLGEAMELRRRIGDARGAAADLNSLGLLAWEVGDLQAARRDFEGALELNRQGRRFDIAATNLTNLAALAALQADFSRALALYEEALATYRDREAWPDAADVLWGLGQVAARRGEYPRAREAFEEALAIYDRTGPLLDAVALRTELAGVLGTMGEVQRAIDEVRRAEAGLAGADASASVRATAAMARADLMVTLSMYAEAEMQYGMAERLFADAADAAGQAEAQHGQGLVLLERESYERARQVLSGAASVQEANQNERGAALTRVLLAEAYRKAGDLGGARNLLHRSVAELARLGDAVGEAYALGALGDLEAAAGMPLVADSAYASGLRLIEGRPATEVRWRLRLGRALAARSTGSLDAAVRELRGAVEEIERASAGIALAERRSAYKAGRVEVYAQLALTERMRGRLASSFEVTERLRAREMLEMLGRGRVAAPMGVPGDLSVREQDLRVLLGELTRELEPLEPTSPAARGARVSEASPAALEALSGARDAYAELLLEMRERTPRDAELLVPRPADWRDVARRLTDRTALVEYLLTDSGSVAFVVTPDTLAAVDLGVRRPELARLIEFSRAALGAAPREAGAPWRGPLERLHDYLVGPVEDGGLLSGVDRLVIVPHGVLHYLPFAALIARNGSYLVERYTLSLAPSASVWLTLGDRAGGGGGAEGVLALAPRPDELPASAGEVAAVARLAGGGVSLQGSDASEAAFRQQASDHGVLHLATFGLLNTRNPLFSALDLAPGGGHDGRLEVHEIFGLELAARLVVLSACQTALGSGALADVPEGDDWVGLTRAFLHAGAERVVATLWAVEDESTARLMESFYESRARGRDDATALAEAQRRALRGASTTHPFHWAGVVLVGQERGADAR